MVDVNEVMSEVMVDNTVETIARMNLKQRDLFAKVLAEKWPELANKLSINIETCLLYTSPSPRDTEVSRMPSSA